MSEPLSPLPVPPRGLDEPRPTPTSDLVSGGARVGTVAASALLGVLVGLGHREGTPWRPLNAAAHAVVGARADDMWGYQGDVTPVGGGVVIVVSLVAGLLTAWLTISHRFFHRAVAAAGVALLGYLLHLQVAARTPGGLAALLSIGELRALYLVLAVALLAGMGFAFSYPKRTQVP